MQGNLRRISAQEKNAADIDNSLYETYVFDEKICELDNWWDQLWFIYDAWIKAHSIENVLNPSYQRNREEEFEVGSDIVYGKPHYLTPEQVKTVYAFLCSVNSQDLLDFALTQTYNDMLYPSDWPEDMQTNEKPHWILSYMKKVSEYFGEASANNEGMLQAIV